MSEVASKMVHVKATCNQVYANKYLKAGDPFPFAIPEHVAASLIKNHYAALDASHQTRARPRVDTKDLVADEDDSVEEASAEEVVAQAEPAAESEITEATITRRQPRRYNRRDLKAEDE